MASRQASPAVPGSDDSGIAAVLEVLASGLNTALQHLNLQVGPAAAGSVCGWETVYARQVCRCEV